MSPRSLPQQGPDLRWGLGSPWAGTQALRSRPATSRRREGPAHQAVTLITPVLAITDKAMGRILALPKDKGDKGQKAPAHVIQML